MGSGITDDAIKTVRIGLTRWIRKTLTLTSTCVSHGDELWAPIWKNAGQASADATFAGGRNKERRHGANTLKMNISVLSTIISMPLNNCLFLPIQQYFGLCLGDQGTWCLCASPSHGTSEPVGQFRVAWIMISRTLTYLTQNVHTSWQQAAGREVGHEFVL